MTEHQFDEPTIQDLEAQHLAVVREKVAFDAIPQLYDRAYPLIFGALAEAGITPAAAPMGVMHGDMSEGLDLSVAVPVAEPFSGAGEVVGERLPAGRAATLLVRGDFSLLSAAYEHLYGWVMAHGHTPGDVAFEQYLTEPEPGGDPALNETLIAVMLA
ncbi:MAG: GyrI-like domain-containing protein [Propioniciclava sp.]|uniref:GyrI-like domain-containing protein n=1 Tax=Propioniciclava sp. TaxID=2038686 RepID=UPI0039E5FF6F